MRLSCSITAPFKRGCSRFPGNAAGPSDQEGRALSGRALHIHGTPVYLNDPLRDGQAQSATASVAGSIGPEKTLKNMGQVRGVNAYTVILYDEPDVGTFRICTQSDVTIGLTVLDGVFRQIDQQLSQQTLVC